MENDLNDNQKEELNSKDFFKPEFDGQKLNKYNKEFQNWKTAKIDKYGKGLELYKCEKDNLIYIDYYNNKNRYHLYESKCPKCGYYSCYFCNIHQKDGALNGNCCIKRRICYLFLESAPKYVENKYDNIKKEDYFLVFPIINFLYFIAGIQLSLFGSIAKKDPKINYYGDLIHDYYEYYQSNKEKVFIFLILIIILFCLTIIIPFILLNIYIIIFILLISIPFKNYPLRYAIGFMISAFKD